MDNFGEEEEHRISSGSATLATVHCARFLIAAVFLFIKSLSLSSQNHEFYYDGFDKGFSSITLNGTAEIEKNATLKLTDLSNRLLSGRAFHKFPLKFITSNGRAPSFSTSFAFLIIPEIPQAPNLCGHGLTFTIAPSHTFLGFPAEYLGLPNLTNNGDFPKHLFAVEFDTFQDPQFLDINDNHVGIDIGSFISNASVAAVYFDDSQTNRALFLKSGKVIKAWIDYDSTQNSLNVSISPYNSKPGIPILSYKVDLSLILNEYMYVGFSAATGVYGSSHYILGWSFRMNGEARELDLSSLPLPFGRRPATLIAVISVSVVVFTVSVLCVVFYLIRRIKHHDRIESWELEIGPRRFSYKELKKATNGFRETELLGQGGFGKVYRGILPISKTEVAVKRISQDSNQGLREFVSEIKTIGLLRHRNLVQLVGWSRRRREDLLLVYDYMANGSLDKYLFHEPEKTLNWEQRMKIIKDVASALLYLHEEYEQAVIHRDVKASNVLLDDDFNGRLGDFGLARVYEHGSVPNSTVAVGTVGYMAPELARTGKATASSDVYAFGMVMLEVVCGRRPVERRAAAEEVVLADWVWENHRDGRILIVVDEKLKGEYDEAEAAMVLRLGIVCSNHRPMRRPSMREVVRCLDGGGGDRVVAGEIEEMNSEAWLDEFLQSFGSSSVNEDEEEEEEEEEASPSQNL